MDDLPTQLKKTKLMDVPLGASKLSELAAFLIVTGEQNGRVGDWWMNEDDLCGVGSLLGRRVRGARVHTDIRQKLFDNERHQDRNRVSVMFEEGASEAKMKDEGVIRVKERMPAWRGMTIFYQDHPSYEAAGVMFVDSLEGLIPVYLTYHDTQNVADIFETWNSVPG